MIEQSSLLQSCENVPCLPMMSPDLTCGHAFKDVGVEQVGRQKRMLDIIRAAVIVVIGSAALFIGMTGVPYD